MSYISIVATISRPDALELVRANLERLIAADHTFEIIFAVDNRSIKRNHIDAISGDLVGKRPIKNIEYFNTGNKPPRVLDIVSRRNRITKLKDQTKNYIGGSDFVFCFEDDCLLPDETIDILIEDWATFASDFDIGFIQGVQVGRWGYPYAAAWRVDDLEQMNQIETMFPPERRATTKIISEVDGGGFYCYLTTTKIYKAASYFWRDPVGPDVWFGLDLRIKGYTNFIDWGLPIGHVTKDGILYPDENTVRIILKRADDRWHQSIEQRKDVAL